MTTFETRIAMHRVVDTMVGESNKVLDSLRGLGIDGRFVKAIAMANVAFRYFGMWISPYDDMATVNDTVLKWLLHAAFQMQPGWNLVSDTWVWLAHSGDGSGRPDIDGHTAAQGGEPSLWAAVRDTFLDSIPCAVMSEQPDGHVRVAADRPTNVRRMTTTEQRLAARVRKYVDTGLRFISFSRRSVISYMYTS